MTQYLKMHRCTLLVVLALTLLLLAGCGVAPQISPAELRATLQQAQRNGSFVCAFGYDNELVQMDGATVISTNNRFLPISPAYRRSGHSVLMRVRPDCPPAPQCQVTILVFQDRERNRVVFIDEDEVGAIVGCYAASELTYRGKSITVNGG